MKKTGVLASLMLIVALTACPSRTNTELVREIPPMQTEQLELGRTVFMENCHRCHPWGGSGVGFSLLRPLPESIIRYQVRNGVGEMPAFRDEQISDEDLDALVEFIVTLREQQALQSQGPRIWQARTRRNNP